jgi:dethiobiotin synthetase
VVEGAGGLLVPLTEEETYADLAVRLALPVLVVARAGLGTVNHTALTVEALRRRGLALAGIVLNRTSPADDPSVPHNAAEIARLTDCEPIAVLPYEPDIAARAARLGSMLGGKIHF